MTKEIELIIDTGRFNIVSGINRIDVDNVYSIEDEMACIINSYRGKVVVRCLGTLGMGEDGYWQVTRIKSFN